jgi:hypothetical protein
MSAWGSQLELNRLLHGQVGRLGALIVILWRPPEILHQQLNERFSHVTFKICHCSIFDSCWVQDTNRLAEEGKTGEPFL